MLVGRFFCSLFREESLLESHFPSFMTFGGRDLAFLRRPFLSASRLASIQDGLALMRQE